MRSFGKDGFAAEQATSYRRGFVLGLTLAETVLLLTFVVLLLLVVGFARREKLYMDEQKKAAELAQALAEAAPIESLSGLSPRQIEAVVEIVREATLSGANWDDEFLELVKTTVSRLSQDPSLADARKLLESERSALEARREEIEKILGNGDSEEALDSLLAEKRQLAGDLERLQGRNRELADQLVRVGGVLPSCWVEGGKPVYVFDVVLESDGLRMRERTPHRLRPELKTLLGGAAVEAKQLLTPTEFLKITRPLFDHSVEEDCRFYVTVFDGTSAEEKDVYKRLMQTVEGHFYKLQSNEAPPF
jgi:hypothetical protein